MSATQTPMTPARLAELAAAADAADQALREGIVQAAREDMPQEDVVAATGRARETIRKIERAADLPPRKRGPRPSAKD